MPNESQLDAAITDLIARNRDRFAEAEAESDADGGSVHDEDVTPSQQDAIEGYRDFTLNVSVAPGPEVRLSNIQSSASSSAAARRVGPCSRCGHEWQTSLPYDPRNCPQCHSAYWDRPRVRAAPIPRYHEAGSTGRRLDPDARIRHWQQRATRTIRRILRECTERHGDIQAFHVLDRALDIHLPLRRRIVEAWKIEEAWNAPQPPPAPPPRPWVIPPPPGREGGG